VLEVETVMASTETVRCVATRQMPSACPARLHSSIDGKRISDSGKRSHRTIARGFGGGGALPH
jgi:hypothetical protein